MLTVLRTPLSRRKAFPILHLPLEIVFEISSHLPVVSQACLVLSCKKFYCEFGYLLKSSFFRYPYSDGLDSISVSIFRRPLLLKLQPKGWSWQSWRYCVACIKLHPRAEFEYEKNCKNWLKNGLRKEHCKWPGIIILCPCVKFSPKKINQIVYELRNSNCLNQASPENTKCLPSWHYCEMSDSSEGLEYSLMISISLEERSVVFHLEYSISLSGRYLGKKRIMLCPHQNAIDYLNMRITWLSGDLPCLLNCFKCVIEPSMTVTDDTNTYRIQYTRKFTECPKGYNVYNNKSLDRSLDYRWDR